MNDVVILPSGVDGALWDTASRVGEVGFRGASLRIEVRQDSDVLFPSDCGLSLLATLSGANAIPVRGQNVLDIGCGCGIYSVAMLSDGAAAVTALDINPAALIATQHNALLNGLLDSRLTCVGKGISDYTAEPFDLVITNPPHLPAGAAYDEETGIKQALIGGEDGRLLYDQIITRAPDIIARDGILLFAHSSLAGIPLTIAKMARHGFAHRVLSTFELDIPLRSYATHAEDIQRSLAVLKRQGRADYHENRFTVQSLAFSRAWT